MTATRSASCIFPIVLGILLFGLAPVLAQGDYSFMPKGGKTLLLEILGSPPDEQELRKVAGERHNEEEWRRTFAVRGKTLSEREWRTLAAYLAVNMPLPEDGLAQAEKRGGLATALPRDGRELAWNECQFCHSLFTSHLTQDRSVQAWLNMFQSPFHREMKMTAQEREEFSRYSTINMPMRVEDVPEELRF